ncbi:MAG: hypothetical protein M1546_14060 [Chloroflexi bacterium]|nr:hypothetical protein [Chloroflexota bacterium]
MNEEEAKQPKDRLVRLEHGAAMRNMMGPLGVDNALRSAVQQCWMILPEDERSPERVEQEILRIIQRVLKELKEDAAAFGFLRENESPPAA